MTTFTGVGSPGTVSSASGGKVYGYNNIGTSPVVVAQPNQNRQKITFCNPSQVDAWVAPVNVQNVLGTAPTTPSNVALVPTTAALGGCIPVLAGSMVSVDGECQGGWQCLFTSGANNPFTVIDSNT